MQIREFREKIPLLEQIKNSTLKSKLKYRKHSSVIVVGDLNNRSSFWFSLVIFEKVLKELRKLNPRKAAQSSDVPVRVLKDNVDIFANYICGLFN